MKPAQDSCTVHYSVVSNHVSMAVVGEFEIYFELRFLLEALYYRCIAKNPHKRLSAVVRRPPTHKWKNIV